MTECEVNVWRKVQQEVFEYDIQQCSAERNCDDTNHLKGYFVLSRVQIRRQESL